MNGFLISLDIFRQIALTLAVGSSTFAIIFYFKAIKDGIIDATEKSFLHTVYTVLRIGLIGLVFFEIILGAYAHTHGADTLLSSPDYLFRCTLLFIIIANAFLMDKHMMPMRFGPVIAGGSWYFYFLMHTGIFFSYGYLSLFSFYLGWLVLFGVILEVVKKLYLPRLPGNTN